MNVFNAIVTLGNDAETRYTSSGSAVVSFSAANNVGFGDNKKTMWLRCSLFGKRGESLAQYLTKGKEVFVTGEIFLNEYQGKDGLTRTSLELKVTEIEFTRGSKEKHEDKKGYNALHDGFEDSEIPF